MATDHQQPETQISTAPTPAAATATAATTTTAAPPAVADPPALDNPTTTVAALANPPKRQRRPSVRLGEIGGDPPNDRRPSKTWRFHKHPSFAAKTSKTRPLTNLVNAQDSLDNYAHRKPKIKKPTKRARTNWNKFDSSIANNGGGAAVLESSSFLQVENDNNDNEEDFLEFEVEGSQSPLLKEQESPINSAENTGLQFWGHQRRGSRTRVSEINGVHLNEGNFGVREWLTELGFGRYAPVFEIHEVDEDVLPMLTLEDLKDMGINAVGSRRKMYSSILKLKKGFS